MAVLEGAMSDDKIADAIARGHEAQMLLNHHVLTELFDAYERGTIAEWKLAKTRRERERFHMAVIVLEVVKNGLEKLAASGRYASAQLEKEAADAALKQRNK